MRWERGRWNTEGSSPATRSVSEKQSGMEREGFRLEENEGMMGQICRERRGGERMREKVRRGWGE